MGAKGAFILGQVNSRQLTSPASTVDAPRIDGINSWDFGVSGTYGWYIGGTPGSVIDRIDFANDNNTALARTNTLAGSGVTSHVAVSNQNYSWNSYNSTVERLNFSNDLNLPILRGSMQETVLSRVAGVSNNNFGWFAGQLAPGVVSQTNVNRIDFANDLTQASRRGNLSTARASGSAGVSNAAYGWIAGGTTPPVAGGPYSSIERIDFSNDTATSVNRSNLTAANTDSAGDGNINFGWFAGGTIPAPAIISTIQRIEYANDTVAATARGPLSAVTRNFAGAGNSNFGWFGGGGNAVPALVSIVNRIDFANDSPTSATARGPLSIARSSVKGVSNIVSTVPSTQYPTQGLGTNESLAGFGWVGGGTNTTPVDTSSIARIDFSNDSPTSAIPRGTLAITVTQAVAASNSNYAWFAGGTQSGIDRSSISRVDFANDLGTAGVRSPLLTARNDMGATGNQNSGYYIGGLISTTVQSRVERIDYANDSTSIARGNISQARILQATGNADYGWAASGAVLAAVWYSLVDRIDYANDLVNSSLRGTLSGGRSRVAAVSNNNYGWWAGGFTPGVVSTIDRIDFANDSPTIAIVRGPLSVAKRSVMAAGNANYGWWIAGINATPVTVSTIERTDYANDTLTASVRGPLNESKNGHGTASNYVKPSLNQIRLTDQFIGGQTFGTFGWVAGGPGIGATSTVQRIEFANDNITASVRGPLSLARERLGSTGNRNYGWWGGGFGPTSVIDRITWSNDSPSAASVRGPLTLARTHAAAAGNIDYGWWAGGGDGTRRTLVDRIDFANDSPMVALVRGSLNTAVSGLAAAANRNYGWWASGTSPTANEISLVQRIDFNNDSVTAGVRGPLPLAIRDVAAVSNDIYGWWAGGYSFPFFRSTITRIDFANDSPVSSTNRGPLVSAISNMTGVGNSTYGWFLGGIGPLTSVQRIDYANDNVTASSRGPLAAGRDSHSGASNYEKRIIFTSVSLYNKGNTSVGTGVGTFGWFAGGSSGASQIDRIDFANDSATASLRGLLTSGKTGMAGVFNADFGWYAGGSPNTTAVDRITFANDSPTTALARGQLTQARRALGGASNSSYGWIGGGYNPSPFGRVTTVDRIDFSNDGAIALLRGFLVNTISSRGVTGNNNFGYWAGGSVPLAPVVSIVERIDFSNDLATALVRGPLSIGRAGQVGLGNSNYGWFGGGIIPAPANVSLVDRIDFANDSPTSASPRGPLTAARQEMGGASNNNFGWFAGGTVGTSVSNVDRIDFANDSPTSASPRGPLTTNRQSNTGVSNYTK